MAIVGGGISGLVSAFELSKNTSLNITIIVGSFTCGCKMKEYFIEEKQRFEEHSIQALASTYSALFDAYIALEFYTNQPLLTIIYCTKVNQVKKIAVDRTETLIYKHSKHL